MPDRARGSYGGDPVSAPALFARVHSGQVSCKRYRAGSEHCHSGPGLRPSAALELHWQTVPDGRMSFPTSYSLQPGRVVGAPPAVNTATLCRFLVVAHKFCPISKELAYEMCPVAMHSPALAGHLRRNDDPKGLRRATHEARLYSAAVRAQLEIP